MAKKLEFFYDYVSPYSYLANSQVGNISGSDLVYRPMFLGAVMQATGNKPPGTLEVKGKYLRKDIARWAEHYGIVYKRNPNFPQNTLKALRLAIVAQHEGIFPEVHDALYKAMFVNEEDLSDDKVLGEIMKLVGLDESATFDRIADPQIKDELKANTEEAVARGAFGAPTFFVGEQMFFGNDRFDFIKEALRA
jgi:2-hydroxychromene-2-carboxylate isomerase